MPPNPLKPLIKGMLAMLFLAAAFIFVFMVRSAIIEDQTRAAENRKRIEESRRQAQAEQDRIQAEIVRNKQALQARREQEAAAARASAAATAATAAAAAEKPTFDVSAGFEKMLRRAAAGDPHAQYVVGYVYFVGMDRVVQVRDSKVVGHNPVVITALNGEMLGSRQLVSPPTIKRDPKVAATWLERSALQGHRGAQVLLAMTHLDNGQGDRKLAYQWLLTCEGPPILPNELRLSNPPPAVIASMKENVRQRLTPEQAAEAEKSAKDFKPKKENT